MSNVDIAKAAYKAFTEGDVAALKDTMAPDVVWWSSEEIQPGGEQRGVDEVMAMFMSIGERWRRFEVRANEFIDAGDRVVVLGSTEVENDRGSATARWAQVLTFNSDGKLTASEIHSDTAKGLKLQN
jgi:hypothetical protein